jgi:hypothetical protein
MLWRAGKFGAIEYAKTHEKIRGAFLTFQKVADQIYPGWKVKLGYSGESSVQAATFNWKKKEAAAAAFLGSVNAKHPKTTPRFLADVGCFSDGTAKYKSVNAMDHPETIGPDSHVDGSVLPVSTYEAEVGYFIDGTAMNAAGDHVRCWGPRLITECDLSARSDDSSGFLDPAGLSRKGDEAGFRNHRADEIKHDGLAMRARNGFPVEMGG